MIIVSDTSCISNLQIIGKLDLLHLIYGKVLIPNAVYSELLQLNKFYPKLQEINSYNWIEVRNVENTELVETLRKELDYGESEAIALAKELSADALVIDETRGRTIAVKLGIYVIGLLGILIQAKQKNLIDSVKPILQELKDKAGFWVGDELYFHVLKRVDE
jgi:hypothetical protein